MGTEYPITEQRYWKQLGHRSKKYTCSFCSGESSDLQARLNPCSVAAILGEDAMQSEHTITQRDAEGGIKDKKLPEENFLFITIAYTRSVWHGDFNQSNLQPTWHL